MCAAASSTSITINRAPVLTLWAAIVAERLGYTRDEALTMGRAVAGLNAQSKGRRLGIYQPAEPGAPKRKLRPAPEGGTTLIELLGRFVPVMKTKQGLRAMADSQPSSPESVERYLESKFGDSLAATRAAMTALAAAFPPRALAVQAFGLYEQFRPAIPSGKQGWGVAGVLDLALVKKLAKSASAEK